jgi:hypothetical protein
MLKGCVLSGIILLLMASGAWAVIVQAQGFTIGAVNFVPWGGGIGSAQNSHQVMIGQEQSTGGAHLSTGGIQKETGVFVQTATAGGSAANTIRQEAQVDGGQAQMAGAQPVRLQGQQMGVGFTTKIDMPSGAAATSGTQSFVGGQTHVLWSPTGMSTESQVVGATQYTAVVGGPGGDPTVKNVLDLQLGQGQIAGIWCPPN